MVTPNPSFKRTAYAAAAVRLGVARSAQVMRDVRLFAFPKGVNKDELEEILSNIRSRLCGCDHTGVYHPRRATSL